MHQGDDVCKRLRRPEEDDGPHASMHSWSSTRDVVTLKVMHSHVEVLWKEVFRGLEALDLRAEETQHVGSGASTAPSPEGNAAVTAHAKPENSDGILARLAALESAVSELRSARNDSLPSNRAGGVGPRDVEMHASSLQREAPRDAAPRDESPPPEEPSDVADVVEEFDYIPDSYTFQESVWDATILLLCKNDGKPLMFKWDIVVLIFSFVINLVAQTLFLVIVRYDMLGDVDLDSDTVDDMLTWRSEHGHVLDAAGLPYIERICDRSYNHWSYVKDVVETWQTYIAMADTDETLISGKYLSLMSLVLWTMTCLKEYRAVVEQAIGIYLLPSPDEGSPWRFEFGRTKFCIEGGQITGEIVSMPYPAKIFIYLVMLMPRLGLLIALSVMGIQFVAQTSTLVDLVLNAIALAFILDIDDFLASLLLTKHVRHCCTEMTPLPCGRTMKGCWAGCTKRDMLKLVVWVMLMMIAIWGYLLPYYNIALASLDALCLGNTAFIVKGANATVPTTIIVDLEDALLPGGSVDSGYYQTCEAALMDSYFDTNYPSLRWDFSDETPRTTQQEIDARAKAITLDYAFLKAPRPLMEELQSALEEKSFSAGEDEYLVWSNDWSAANMQECPRFETHYQSGWAACVPMPVLDETIPNCSWTRGADLCDGDPPGDIYRMACGLSSQTAKEYSCSVWAAFWTDNPYLNCQKVVNGTGVELDASLSLEVADPEYFVMQVQQNSTIYDALVQTLADALESLPEGVAAPHSSRIDIRDVLVVYSGVSGLLPVAGGEEGSAAEGRALDVEAVNDLSTTEDEEVANTSITTTPGKINIPVKVLDAPDTLTKDYFSQVNWTQVAERLSSVLTAFDSRFRVHGFLNQSSAVKAASCSSYLWCEDIGKSLKMNAAAIPGSTAEACCDETCWYWNQQDDSLIPQACAGLTTPSEILRSEDALQATVVNKPTSYGDFQPCCEEQLRCDVYDADLCLDLHEGSVLINDAHNVYQGVQNKDPDVVLTLCCSFTCQSASDSVAPCDAEQGLTLVANASYEHPSVEWQEDLGETFPVLRDFADECCEGTTVLCSTWYSQNENGCVTDEGVPLLISWTASTVYGEHYSRCCSDSCYSYSFYFGGPDCPKGQRPLRDDYAAATYYVYYYEHWCCYQPVCGEYYDYFACAAMSRSFVTDHDTPATPGSWLADCCLDTCGTHYLNCEYYGDNCCPEGEEFVDYADQVVPEEGGVCCQR